MNGADVWRLTAQTARRNGGTLHTHARPTGALEENAQDEDKRRTRAESHGPVYCMECEFVHIIYLYASVLVEAAISFSCVRSM